MSDDVDWKTALSGVQRMPPSPHVPRQKSNAPLPIPKQSVADQAAVMRELLQDPTDPEDFESGDTLQYRDPTVSDAIWRKLRRGEYRLEAELDLHGLNRDKAREEVSGFLAWCRAQSITVARVIHGKGNGSPNSGPVIKRYLESWLGRSRQVLAFCSARPCDGGTGAVYVLLRK